MSVEIFGGPDILYTFSFQNKTGKVARRDFKNVIDGFCFRLSDSQFSKLMTILDPSNKGYVTYPNFFKLFDDSETNVSNNTMTICLHCGPWQTFYLFDVWISLLLTVQLSSLPQEGHKWLTSVHRVNKSITPQYMEDVQFEEVLAKKITDDRKQVSLAFSQYDREGTGLVSKGELRKFLERFRVPFSKVRTAYL